METQQCLFLTKEKMKTYFLISFMALTFLVKGQCYSITTIPYSPVSYSGTPVSLGDNIFAPTVPIGFSFCYYGAVYDSLTIGSNGIVSFSPEYAQGWCHSNIGGNPLPNPYSGVCPKNCVMLPWQDLDPSLGGTITYSINGISPSRALVVSFDNVPMDSCGKFFKGQVKLFETTNIIETHIANKDTCSNWNGGNAIHGLHGTAGIDTTTVPNTIWVTGIFVGGRNAPNCQWETTNEGTRFTPTCNVCTGLAVNENHLDSKLSIFPNPFSTQTVLRTEALFHDAILTLTNCLGETVKQVRNISGQTVTLFRDNLPSGIYFLRLTQDGKVIAQDKLVVADN